MAPRIREQIEHGTASGYCGTSQHAPCRCQECRAAWAAYMKRYRRRASGMHWIKKNGKTS